MNFEEFHWHDSIIKNITINRDNPGIKDEIKIEIVWADNKEGVNFIFEDVYLARMDFNFGIIASESILKSCILSKNDEDLINIYSLWEGFLNNIKLNAYEIELNSTRGRIKIIAKSFRVDKL